MFADAFKITSGFTRPVIISTRFFDKTVECGCGAFIVINDEGWIMTAAHIFESLLAYHQNAKEISDYYEKKQEKANPKWITNHSFWWGDGVQIKDIKLFQEGDLAIGRLDPFDPNTVKIYPVFKNTKCLDIGTSLCKLGFPFHDVKASFNETKNTFELAPGSVPLPFFPLEGIYTRDVVTGKSNDGKYEIRFLETSSPGLRGQSGGPIFDKNGTIWAVQSRTSHFPLGFSPKIKRNGIEVEENQFLNVGMGVHIKLILKFLRENSIKHNISDY
jgi:hypothetical protein